MSQRIITICQPFSLNECDGKGVVCDWSTKAAFSLLFYIGYDT